MIRKKKQYHELKEQIALAKWLGRLQEWGRIQKFTTIPNSTYTPYYSELNRVNVGLQKGLPDFFVLTHKFQVWIELKRPEQGKAKVSPEQLEWIELLKQHSNTVAFVAYGAEDAIQKITPFIPNVSPPSHDQETVAERSAAVDAFARFADGN